MKEHNEKDVEKGEILINGKTLQQHLAEEQDYEKQQAILKEFRASTSEHALYKKVNGMRLRKSGVSKTDVRRNSSGVKQFSKSEVRMKDLEKRCANIVPDASSLDAKVLIVSTRGRSVSKDTVVDVLRTVDPTFKGTAAECKRVGNILSKAYSVPFLQEFFERTIPVQTDRNAGRAPYVYKWIGNSNADVVKDGILASYKEYHSPKARKERAAKKQESESGTEELSRNSVSDTEQSSRNSVAQTGTEELSRNSDVQSDADYYAQKEAEYETRKMWVGLGEAVEYAKKKGIKMLITIET